MAKHQEKQINNFSVINKTSERVCAICGVSNKEKRVNFNNLYQAPLCHKHAYQIKKYGKELSETMYTKNKIIIKNDHAEIELKDRKFNIVGYALIDIEDIDKCKKVKWAMRKNKNTCYAYGLYNGVLTGLHRYILEYEGKLKVDHINRNGLDNRKNNLRIITSNLNQLNSEAKGVIKQGNRYGATFQAYGKVYYCGYYNSYEEAKQIAAICRQKFIENPENFIKEYILFKQKKKDTYHIYKTNSGKWRPYIYRNSKKIYLGVYDSLAEAIKIRNDADRCDTYES